MTTATPVRPANLGPEFIHARVSIDGGDGDPDSIFWAWVDPTNRWNGFAQPVFEWAEAVKVAEWANQSAASAAERDWFIWTGAKTLVQVHGYGDDEVRDEDLVTIYRGPTYGIADGWCWQFVEDPRYALKRDGVAAASLLTAAAGLLESENLTLDQEYTRGICELLADTILLTSEVFMDERKEIVLALLQQEKARG